MTTLYENASAANKDLEYAVLAAYWRPSLCRYPRYESPALNCNGTIQVIYARKSV